jgi:ABC-type polysaccharide/polyol phosphate export permease
MYASPQSTHHRKTGTVCLQLFDVLMDGHPPRWELLLKLTFVALFTFSLGFIVFQQLKRRFYDHL